MNDNPIGVYDSGLGGLTVWRELRRALPRESLVYLGDGKNCPYGSRPAEEIRTLADRAYELTSFLVDVLKLSAVPNQFDGSVTYHDSCKGLRGLAIKRQPRDLLARVPGLSLKEMSECEECCGFGGAFSVKFGEVSTKIVDRKCDAIAAAGADAVVGGDLGCLMNIEGRLRRRGDETTRVLHIAEVLAGGEA